MLRSFFILACLLASLCRAEAPATRPQLDLRVDSAEWNDDTARVELILRSAAAEFLQHFPDARPEPVLVYAKGGPIVLFKRNDDRRIVMKLSTGDRLWAQYIFQFSHEFCHTLARYREEDPGNKWFEESLCELASLYQLRHLGRQWKERPPFPAMRNFSPHLITYAEDRIKLAPLPEGKTLAAWYRDNADALRKKKDDRPKNNVVAVALLPLFEAEPKHWNAVWYINQSRETGVRTFPRYLQDWHDAAPAEHRAFIRKLAGRFEIKLGQK